MLDWLTVSTRANPDNLALIYADQQWTYRELDQQVNAACAWLKHQGIVAGQRIAVLMPNCPEYVILVHALIRLGAVIVPLNTRLTTIELAYQVTKVQAAMVISTEATAKIAAELPCPALVMSLAAFALFNANPPAQCTLDLDAPHAIIFTSGTTGNPKGAILTYGNHFYGAMASAYRIGTLPDDRWLCCLPLYHVGGLNILMRCCLYGTTVVLHNGFNVEAVNHALAQQAVTLISLVPTMLYRLLDTAFNAPNLRLVLLGGAAATPDLMERCTAASIPVATTYGLTEADSQVATQTPASTLRKPGSVGKPLPFNTVEILNEAGEAQPAGEIGEIVISGPTVMQGYFGDPEATLQNSKLYTGDLGYFDAEGDLWLVQRRSDLIVSGGENVYPAEIEIILKQHPAIADACVVGIPDAEWGQKVAAAVVLQPNANLTTDELTAFCRQHLAGYKIPRLIRVVEALPLTASGKIERKTVTLWLSS